MNRGGLKRLKWMTHQTQIRKIKTIPDPTRLVDKKILTNLLVGDKELVLHYLFVFGRRKL